MPWARRGRIKADRVGPASKVALLASGDAADDGANLFLPDGTGLLLVERYAVDIGATIRDDSSTPPLRGNIERLLDDCRRGEIDAVILAELPADTPTLLRLQAALHNYAVDLYMLPEHVGVAGPFARPATLAGQPMLLVRERPLNRWQSLAKATFDRFCAAVILVLIAPFLAIVAALVRIDSRGPILFRQARVGYHNRLFRILKFRTMHASAADPLATRQTTKDDDRVTRVGRVLRRFSVDELPQLINVLSGDMSLVGPRPHAPGTSAGGQRVDLLIDNYRRRHLVKPGITGLAQVRGFRGGMATMEHVSRRVQCDLEYIRRQSLWLDVKIIVLTLTREVFGGRAV